MIKFSDLRIRTKLVGGFVVVAIITGIVGTTGFLSARRLAEGQEVIVTQHLPASVNLLHISREASEVKAAQRTLLNPELDAKTRARQYDNIAKSREIYAEAFKVYEAIPRDAAEDRVWKEFEKAWQEWRGHNDEFFRVVKNFEALSVTNPHELMDYLNRFRGDHYRLRVMASEMTSDRKVFDGGEDHRTCAFGKWRAEQNFDNAELNKLLTGSDAEHERFHKGIVRAKELIRNGDVKAAEQVYREEIRPASESVAASLDKIRDFAENAAKLVDQASIQAMTVCRESGAKAAKLLGNLVDTANQQATEETEAATQLAARAEWLTSGGTIVGVLIALVTGIVLSGVLARPVIQVAEVLKCLASGDYSRKVTYVGEDEIGQMSRSLNVAIDATAKAMNDVKEAAEREKQLQAQRVEEERKAVEAENRRKAEEAERERQRVEAEQRLKDEQAAKERELAAIEQKRAEELRRKVDQLLQVVRAAAQGDLTKKVTVEGNEAIDELAGGIKQMLGDLSGVIGQVTESAAQFNEGARVIAESSQTLANASQTQSSSVEQMTASIEELARSIESVRDRAKEADTVALNASQLAEQGGQAVRKSVESMGLIRTSSQQIGEIIQVISEIASQTNLLALNAAIEAARAGEHGMGFAVVADEVRKLAERSNQAAREISSLIKESTARVEEGSQLSEQTGASLQQIVRAVEATAAKIAEIATATVQQASNAKEVSQAIQGVAQVTEQTAAGSEEMASSSEELGAQAGALRDLVGRFRV